MWKNANNFEKTTPVEGPIEIYTKEEVRNAVKSMKNVKAPGPSGISSEMVKLEMVKLEALEWRNSWLCFSGYSMRRDALSCENNNKYSHTVPLYKGKGDPLDSTTHRGLRPL